MAKLQSLVKTSKIGTSHIGAVLLPINATIGKPLQHQGTKLFVPASTMKLFTTAAAFDVIGADKKLNTTFLHTGSLQNGTVSGDLIILGGGDPSFAAEWCKPADLCMNGVAQKLHAQGVTTVTGDLVADVSLYTGPSIGPAWEWDDLSYYYATPVAALSCGENTSEVRVLPTKNGKPLRLESTPSGYFSFQNFGLTRGKKGRITIMRELGKEVVTVRGRLGTRSKGVSAAVAVNDPVAYFLFRFKQALKKAGISVQGGTRVVRKAMAEPGTLLWERKSPPLREIATVTNMESHNLFAEMLQHAVAVEKTGQGSFALGASQVTEWARQLGVPGQQLLIADGSGLSRKSMFSPMAMAIMLKNMVERPSFAEFYASMPVSGRHGSMRGRLRGTLGEGKVHAKVGYLTGHSSIAGYAQDPKGRWFTFAVMVNNHALAPRLARQLQDAVVTLIVGKKEAKKKRKRKS